MGVVSGEIPDRMATYLNPDGIGVVLVVFFRNKGSDRFGIVLGAAMASILS